MSDRISQNKSISGLHLWGKALSHARTFHCNDESDTSAITYLTLQDFADTGADITETEGLPAALMSIRGVMTAVTLTEYPPKKSGKIRASFRSRPGSAVGAGTVARLLGGGGHEHAAGATLDGPLEECIERIEALILSKYHECLNPHQ